MSEGKKGSTAREQWLRYEYMRDTGHLEYLHKSYKCEDFFAGYPGLQWDPSVASRLRSERRPFLTINKILPTLSSIIGEQIDLRTELVYKGRYGAPSGNADTLTKLHKWIADQNQMEWVRTEMFADGAITSRGFVDVRMDFDKSTTGDIKITNLNPRNVVLDPDALEYDPDSWGDVIVTSWLSLNTIKHLYGEKVAKELLGRTTGSAAYGYDSVDDMRDRFGGPARIAVTARDGEDEDVTRMYRVIDRQHRQLTTVKFFVDLKTGDRKRVPDTFDRERIAATLSNQSGSIVVDEMPAMRIRWTVTSDDVEMHDEWSPYKHFTVIPFFPVLRKGRTIGLVENEIDPQELLNKATSQELHVVNTTANSGWKIKANSLKNMSMDELEMRGAQSGVVLELADVNDAEKIQPNSIPQGLDRLSQKAENYIKSVSGRGDAQMGMARADASADQIEANNVRGDQQMRWPLDNLKRTDWILARNMLDLIQDYITDPRTLKVTHNELTGEQTDIMINWPDPSTGEVLNDLTLGEYDVSVVLAPHKQTLEQSQFDQLAYMREKLGIQIPDEFILQNSQAINKSGIIAALKQAAESAEAQQKVELQKTAAMLEVAQLKAEATRLEADALLKRAKAAHTVAQTATESQGQPGEQEKAQQEMQLKSQEHQQDMQMQREKHDQEMQLAREKAQLEAETKKMMAQEDARIKRAQAIMTMRGKGPGQGQQGGKSQQGEQTK